ncbi:MAG: ATP-binding protein [Endomicrobia bacterium]|nr:ATP-binding protein [Endomicrobiia bacterium]
MKNKKSLFKTLLIIFIIKYSVVGMLLFTGAKKYVHSSNVELFTHELISNANIIIPVIEESLITKEHAVLHSIVRAMASNSNNRMTIIDTAGNVLMDSAHDADKMQNHANREEIKAVIDGHPHGKSMRYSSTLQKNMLYMALPVNVDGELAAILRLSVPVNEISVFTNAVFKNMAFIFFLIILIALAASYLISKKIASNISKLSDAAMEMASGNFGVRVDIDSKDEIGALAQSFNKMSDEINILFKEVNEGKEMLDKVLASVSDSIIMIDKSDKTLLFNDAFKSMFPDTQTGRHFWEFLRSKAIEDALRKMKDSKTDNMISGEFSSAGKDFTFVISKVKNEDKFVISLKDVTKFKQLENLKKDFITNASHELKTPVTAIIGFAETLEAEELSAEDRRYVEVIKKQAQRLSNIINDLLSLSSFENIKESEKKELNIVNVIDNVVSFYLKKSAEKGIKITSSAQHDLKNIYANEFNMEQLFINLVDNALKYTEKGEINIKAENAGEFVSVTVSDTGIGIPEEHISRLFERFYVVDKSRSKKSGGTGLGLSIVKHIVQLHHGSISIESAEGAGSKFKILLPCFVRV